MTGARGTIRIERRPAKSGSIVGCLKPGSSGKLPRFLSSQTLFVILSSPALLACVALHGRMLTVAAAAAFAANSKIPEEIQLFS